MRKAATIRVTEKERTKLSALSRAKKVTVRLAQRSAIILLADDGLENIALAARLKITRQKVSHWRNQYAAQSLAGIAIDAPRAGRIPEISSARKQQVVRLTLEEKPPAATH